MGLFKCKHKEIRVIQCNLKDRHYTVGCVKCGEQWKEAKAVGEDYQLGKVIKRG